MLILACVAVILVAAKNGLIGKRGELTINPCDQPAMSVSVLGGQIFSLAAAQTAVPVGTPGTSVPPAETPTTQAGATATGPQPILSSAFMELPFPFDGGNENFGGTDEQFKLASQRNLGEGTAGARAPSTSRAPRMAVGPLAHLRSCRRRDVFTWATGAAPASPSWTARSW